MDEFQINDAGAEEVIGDDFYEEIEAPKFVDFSALDRCHTEHDDRYWFCLRVGCDQKHEEEMDSEAIYKNFVLRVMAARSPSVGLRKALGKRDSRSKLECPRTVPAKSSKSSVSKLAMISSILQKMGEAKVKVIHVPKQGSSSPNVKAAKQSSTKALTTPRNQKGLLNPGTFQSVRNPKPTTIEVPKDRVVAKALVFHSPKKVVKLKKSVEWSSSLRKVCAGMKKLEINDGSKKNALGCINKPLDVQRKQLRGREVKSRVYDSLHCQKQMNEEAKSVKRLKKKNSNKDLLLSEAPMYRKPDEKDLVESPSDSLEQAVSENTKISSPSRCNNKPLDVPRKQLRGREVKSRLYDSLHCQKQMNEEAKSVKRLKKKNSNKDLPLSEAPMYRKPDEKDLVESPSDSLEQAVSENTKISSPSRSKMASISESEGDNEINESSSHEENIEPCSNDIEIPEATMNDDKENALASNIRVSENSKENTTASDENRGKTVKKYVLGRHETSKNIQKGTNGMNKTMREKIKERGILKEANLEKKHLQAPLKETNTFRDPKINENSDNGSDTITLQDQPHTIKTSSLKKSQRLAETKISYCTPQKRIVPMHQKMTFSSVMVKGQDKAAKKSEGRLEKTKSPTVKQLVRPRGLASSRKKPAQISAIRNITYNAQ
ncbi:Detected protein of unknown function [Hibiscus syriacus]|uniref:Uncharacterized protein n=1 Tax=Hibiscus syriacus TaxID=106335 RepID=A0A6A3C0M4_HIBSY|nr:Detected protein of unknown function [Hibiscus syriacus]